MKFVVLFLLSTVAAFGSEVRFKCEFTDTTYVNQFSLEGSAQIEDGKFYNTEFDFSLRKAGRNQQTERFTLTRDGSYEVFAAGTFYRHSTARLASVVKGAEVEYMNLLLDMPPLHTSQIRFLDGFTYYGSCKSVR